MNERVKLAEARYFMARMVAEASNPTHFGYELSAFLSAARTVLQYALEEAKTKQKGQSWYDAAVASSTTAKLFRDKRNLSIHHRPVTPDIRNVFPLTGQTADDSPFALEVLSNGEGVIIYGFESDEFGRTVPSASPQPVVPRDEDSVVFPLGQSQVLYSFDDWGGTEDVITLCQRYITEIEAIVAGGVSKGYISG